MSAPPKDRGPAPPEWPIQSSTGRESRSDGAPALARSGSREPAVKAGQPQGKIVHDKRGNAKLDLGVDTGRLRQLTQTDVLMKLNASALSLLDDEPDPSESVAWPHGSGFNPYNKSRAPDRGSGSGGSSSIARTPGKPRR